MADYPAEYMLQSPNIFVNLINILEHCPNNKCSMDELSATLLIYLDLLKKRLKNRRKISLYASKDSDSSTEMSRTQLRVDKAIKLLFEKCLNLLEFYIQEFHIEIIYVINLLNSILEVYAMQHLIVDELNVMHLARIVQSLYNITAESNTVTLPRIQYLIIVNILQQVLENNAKKEPITILPQIQALLHDFAFSQEYPNCYNKLKHMLTQQDSTLEQKLALRSDYLKAINECFHIIKPCQPKNNTNALDIVNKGQNICKVIPLLKSSQLLSVLLDSVVTCNAHYCTQQQLRENAIQIIMQLLNLTDINLKKLAFSKISEVMNTHFALLMDGEAYICGLPNEHLFAAKILGIPLNTELLQIVLSNYNESVDENIQNCACCILTVVLRSKYLMNKQNWFGFLEIILPIMPLMIALPKSSSIMQELIKLLDPDGDCMPYLSMFTGNIALLFHADSELRSEALTRLIFILNNQPNGDSYVPNIMEISDLIPNDLCIHLSPRELHHIFGSTSSVVDLSSIYNLCNILETSDVEPIIRKTTLMQLNLMCESWKVAQTVCNEHAYYLALMAIENSLKRISYSDYADAVIPAIGILSKALICDAALRQELSETANIFALLLRAMMLYQNDIQVSHYLS